MSPEGPLAGIRVLEFSGIGPGPFAGMLLADMGAEVVTIDRPGADPFRVISRGKASLVLDLKSETDRVLAHRALAAADVLIEGFRPGVMERLGLGPEAVAVINPRLIYARMTGWGQDGPSAQMAGHDLSYIAVTGALAAIGPADRPPPPPINLVGDFGGGSLYLAMGICAALLERTRSGKGQVIDVSILDGTASLMASLMAFPPAGAMLARESSILGGASPSYRCYTCADGKYVAVAALEPQFFAELLRLLEIDPATLGDRHDLAQWERIGRTIAARFATRPRDEWTALFDGTDACVSPVLTIDEAGNHPQLRERDVYVTTDGLPQPAPAPRFARTPARIAGPSPAAGEGGFERLRGWGVAI